MKPQNVKLITHPLVSDLVSHLRDAKTSSLLFRTYSKEMSKMLFYEALKDLKTKPKKVITQTGIEFEGPVVNEKVVFVAILRAAMGMLATAMEIYPEGEFHVVGVKRSEDPMKKAPYFYLDRLNEIDKNASRVLVLDPMLATGGSMLTVVDALRVKYKFPKRIQIVSYIAALKGAELINNKYPDVDIYCAGFDQKLNSNAYIVPGLGDAGDKYFGINSDLSSIV